TSLIIAILILSVLTFVGVRSRVHGTRCVIVIAIFAFIIFELAFGGGSLRALADIARAEGRTFEYVEGLARMNKEMMPVKIVVLFSSLAILIVGIAGGKR
ncbi:hypothetical protein AB4084_25950, partial [Lysobacter sp. 2RAB21]